MNKTELAKRLYAIFHANAGGSLYTAPYWPDVDPMVQSHWEMVAQDILDNWYLSRMSSGIGDPPCLQGDAEKLQKFWEYMKNS